MQDIFKLLIGFAVLMLGIPIGNILAKNTNEELKDGKKWFMLLIIISLIGAIFGLIFSSDTLFFGFLFIAIVTSRSLVGKREKDEKKNKKRRKV